MGQLLKPVLILVIVGFIAAALAAAITWLADAVVATAPVWLAGGVAGCLTAWLHCHVRWRQLRRAGTDDSSWSGRYEIERSLEPALGLWVGAAAAVAVTVTGISIAAAPEESAPAMLPEDLVGAVLAVAMVRRIVPYLRRLYLWRAEVWLRKALPPEIALGPPLSLPLRGGNKTLSAGVGRIKRRSRPFGRG